MGKSIMSPPLERDSYPLKMPRSCRVTSSSRFKRRTSSLSSERLVVFLFCIVFQKRMVQVASTGMQLSRCHILAGCSVSCACIAIAHVASLTASASL